MNPKETSIAKEIQACRDYPLYFYATYFHTYDPNRGIIPLDYHYDQVRLFQHYHSHINAISKCERGVGSTTAGLAYVLWYGLFDDIPNKNIYIFSDRVESVERCIQGLRVAINVLPSWLTDKVYSTNRTGIQFRNGSKIRGMTAVSNNIRGLQPEMIYCDNFGNTRSKHEQMEFFHTLSIFSAKNYPTTMPPKIILNYHTNSKHGLDYGIDIDKYAFTTATEPLYHI